MFFFDKLSSRMLWTLIAPTGFLLVGAACLIFAFSYSIVNSRSTNIEIGPLRIALKQSILITQNIDKSVSDLILEIDALEKGKFNQISPENTYLSSSLFSNFKDKLEEQKSLIISHKKELDKIKKELENIK